MSTQIKIFGIGDQKTLALRQNRMHALNRYPVDVKLSHVSEVNAITLSGANRIPALEVDGQLVSEGDVPSVENLMDMLKNRSLYKAKLHNIKKILVPTDFSPISENAFRFALGLAEVLGASVDLFHVSDSIYNQPLGQAFSSEMGYQQRLRKELEDLIQKYAPAKGEPLQPDEEWLRVNSRLEFGFPETAIVEASTDYDLVVMGTHGEKGFLEKLLGSVTVDVVQNAHAPVLVVPQGATFDGLNSIAYASNFESCDVEKIRQVVGFSKQFDAQIHFVHIGEMPNSHDAFEQNLFQLCYKETNPNKPFLFKHILDEGSLSQTINHYGDLNNIGLTVLLTHRRGLLQSLVHKSATKDMVFYGNRPFMVVHQFNDIRKI